MQRIALVLPILAALLPVSPLAAREVVEASAPRKVAVTVYRDPNRSENDTMDTDFPQGFAMISETRRVRLPAGESTILFNGVAEGMVAVTAIVTGLPGGTIEKNRNADLLSPGALVDGTLGNRVRITRTNPATGKSVSEQATIRTRADGGLVLQTAGGYEAVRCSGLPEKLSFPGVPTGLSAQPVFSIDTNSPRGGIYTVTLTYLASGFDWQAHYVASLKERGARGEVKLGLLSWLTLLNDNGQSFKDAELMAVAGKLNVVSDYEDMSEAPEGRPLSLTCFPIGSTAAGSPVPYYPPSAFAGFALPAPMMEDGAIVVTAARAEKSAVDNMVSPISVMQAEEEQLGDLKLYRVPMPVTVNAKGMKQVAFLNKEEVDGKLFYEASCSLGTISNLLSQSDWLLDSTMLLLETKNDEEHGLGVALPTGGITMFEPSLRGDLLLAEDWLRDYAKGQDVEIELGKSELVRSACGKSNASWYNAVEWETVGARISNARGRPVIVRVYIGREGYEDARKEGERLKIKGGRFYIDVEVPAGATKEVRWEMRSR